MELIMGGVFLALVMWATLYGFATGMSWCIRKAVDVVSSLVQGD